jgi:hypothetical protein
MAWRGSGEKGIHGGKVLIAKRWERQMKADSHSIPSCYLLEPPGRTCFTFLRYLPCFHLQYLSELAVVV